MYLAKQFLPQDREDAFAEYMAAVDCLDRVAQCLVSGDLKEVKLTISDLSNSVREIEKLQNKKLQHDELVSIIKYLSKNGVRIHIGGAS